MAWTAALQKIIASTNGFGTLELHYLYTSDGSAGAHTFTHRRMKDKYLQEVITSPAAAPVAPSAAYTLTIKDVDGTTIDTLLTRSVDTIERENIPSNTGKQWKMTDGSLTVTFGDLGDAGDQVTVKYLFAE